MTSTTVSTGLLSSVLSNGPHQAVEQESSLHAALPGCNEAWMPSANILPH